MKRIPNEKMKTLSECINMLYKSEYKESFAVKGNKLYAPECKKFYGPDEISIVNFYRFEGISDPADNSILYAIETRDGTRGVLVDAYGAYADEKITEFVRQVEDIQKKTDRDVKI